MNATCSNVNNLNENDLEQFKGTICYVLNGINNIFDRKNFKGRTKFALLCRYWSSHGHTMGRCFKKFEKSLTRQKEKSFYGHMRNNQILPNRQIDSNNVNGRQLPSTTPVYNCSRSRTPYRSQSKNGYYNRCNSRDNRNYQGSRNYHRSTNDRRISYNRNNYNRSRNNSYNRNNNYYKYSNRSNSRYTNRSNSRQNSPCNRNNYNNNNINNNNRQRQYSRHSTAKNRFRER